MPDHPTPTLHQAAEALLRLFDESGHFRGSMELFRAETGAPACPRDDPGISRWMRKYEAWDRKHALALRAALSAEAAWRARAEAAVARCEAEDAFATLMGTKGSIGGFDLMDKANQVRMTRRRYEETCDANG